MPLFISLDYHWEIIIGLLKGGNGLILVRTRHGFVDHQLIVNLKQNYMTHSMSLFLSGKY